MASLDQIAQAEALLEAIDAGILEIVSGRASSYSISGGGASRSKTFLSLAELQDLKKDTEARLRRLRGRKNIYIAFGQVRSG